MHSVGTERALAFVAPELTFENTGEPGVGPFLLRRLGIRFENTSDKMLSYRVEILKYGLEGFQESDAHPNGSTRYIPPNRPMTYSGDLSPALGIEALPARIRVTFKISYDNVPPVNERSTAQTIEYTLTSIQPLHSTNLILAHTEA